MNRYRDTKTIIKKNTRYYKQTLYNKIPVTDDDIYIISQFGDRLDTLAYAFYNDSTLWWYIARANNLSGVNIKENIQLRIPGSTIYAKGE